MSLLRKIIKRTERRALRVRSKITDELPRVSVFRSLKHISAQIIDGKQQRTLASCSTIQLKDMKGDKKDQARAIGKELAARALSQGIKVAVFDRGSYLYHGRVKSLVEGLREGGLTI